MNQREFINNKQEVEIKYAPPLSISEYLGSSICEAEKKCDASTLVGQSSGKLVEGGSLYSEGFSKCTAFVIENTETKEGGLFHVADIDFEVRHQALLEDFFIKWLGTRNVEGEEKQKLSLAISDICRYSYPRTMKREEIAPRLKQLGIGHIQTKLFSGTSGRYTVDTRLRQSMLDFLGVDLPKTLIFDNKNSHWAILVDFEKRSVGIAIPSQNYVLGFEL